MPFEFTPLDIEDVHLVETTVFEDQRGHLFETFERDDFAEAGLMEEVVLEFQSRSGGGVLRGLHFQHPPYEQAKLVRCLDGEIFDVAVDIRPESSTFGEYVARKLSGDEQDALFIPEGFAHGFATMTDVATVDYKVTARYAPDHEGGIIWDDPTVDIDWPLDEDPTLSKKDDQWPTLREVRDDL